MNADDRRDYRPGQRAAQEHDVLAPLAEVGLDQAGDSSAGKGAGYTLWDRPAAPCLSSRVEYGRTVTREVLEQVEQGEESMRQLGFREFRVRHHGELARVEISRAEMPGAHCRWRCWTRSPRRCEQAGFQYVTLDCAGFRSGSLECGIAGRSAAAARRLAQQFRISSMRIGYLECFSGISGDMLLGAMVDAGVPFALLEETTAALNVGARLEMRKVIRGGLAGTKVDVVIEKTMLMADHAHATSTRIAIAIMTRACA